MAARPTETSDEPIDVERYLVDIPPPRYAPTALPGIEAVHEARRALATRYFDEDAVSSDEYERQLAQLGRREAALRLERDDAIADVDDELAGIHEAIVVDRDGMPYDAAVETVERLRVRGVHLLVVRRQLLQLAGEPERREWYERERARPIAELAMEYRQPSPTNTMTRDFQLTGRFRDVAARYVEVLLDEGRSDPSLLESARRALADVRRWECERDERREAYEELKLLVRPDELAAVDPLLERLGAEGVAYTRLPRQAAAERLRKSLRSAATDRGIRLITRLLEMRPDTCLVAAVHGRADDHRRLVIALWKSR
jgi:hypothetical protein